MNLKIQHTCSGIDWDYVAATLKAVGMAYHEASVHEKAFKNSHTVVFVFDDATLVGFGRAISDGAYQAAIYDVAILPEYQGKGIGRTIVDTITSGLPGCNFILYAAPGKDKFYEALNFRKMKSGMALFLDADRMRLKGFTE